MSTYENIATLALNGGNDTEFADVDLSNFVPPIAHSAQVQFVVVDESGKSMDQGYVGFIRTKGSEAEPIGLPSQGVESKGSFSIAVDANKTIQYRVLDKEKKAYIAVEGYGDIKL